MRGIVRIVLVLASVLVSAPVTAKPLEKSLRPHPRPVVVVPGAVETPITVPTPTPVVEALAVPVVTASEPPKGPRPKARPANFVPQLAVAPSTTIVSEVAPARVGPRPKRRPADLIAKIPDPVVQQGAVEQLASAAESPPKERKGLFGLLKPTKRPDTTPKETPKQTAQKKNVKGSVCGDPDIRGEVLARIPSKVKGCGIEKPVRVTQIAGIRFSTSATINCDTAKAIKKWIERGVVPTYGKGKVVELEIAASYSCRPRNNVRGAKVSEHGRGNAIDIGGLTFSNGKSVSVLKNYDKNMRKIHKAACGIFGTTLGPGSDGYHENHLHFDVARYRNPYCR